MVDGGIQRLAELGYIQPAVVRAVELYFLGGNKEGGGAGACIINRLAQSMQALAQVRSPLGVRPVGPQQFSQRFSAVRTLGFQRQVRPARRALCRRRSRSEAARLG